MSRVFAISALLALAAAIVAHILRLDAAAESAGDVAFFAALMSAIMPPPAKTEKQ